MQPGRLARGEARAAFHRRRSVSADAARSATKLIAQGTPWIAGQDDAHHERESRTGEFTPGLALTTEDLDHFSFTPTTLTFCFRVSFGGSYAVGPYPQGYYFGHIPMDTIRGLLDPTGPLGAWAKVGR